MRFWDSSALVSLIVPEAASVAVHKLRQEDAGIAVWWSSEVECVSAFWRQRRAERLTQEALTPALADLASLLEGCEIVLPSEVVRERAVRLLALHSLGSADALQLAAALVWTRERPSGVGFVSGDMRLREAAEREGFAVQPA